MAETATTATADKETTGAQENLKSKIEEDRWLVSILLLKYLRLMPNRDGLLSY